MNLKIGDKHNMLTAIEPRKNGYWLFKCDCGEERLIRSDAVTRKGKKGGQISCGCHKRKIMNQFHDRRNVVFECDERFRSGK